MLLDNLDSEGIVIAKRGKPVARLIPASSSCADLIGSRRDKIQVHGDILSTGIKWHAKQKLRRAWQNLFSVQTPSPVILSQHERSAAAESEGAVEEPRRYPEQPCSVREFSQ